MATITVPGKNGETRQVSGRLVKLYVGNTQYKFLIQEEQTSEKYLTHFDSGYKIASLTPEKLSAHRSYYTITDREAAICALDKLVKKYGVDTVQQRLNAAPVIN